MADMKEEPIVVTITAPDGSEQDFAQDVVIPYQENSLRFSFRFRNRRKIRRNRKSFWHGLIRTTTVNRNMYRLPMKSTMRSKRFTMKCDPESGASGSAFFVAGKGR